MNHRHIIRVELMEKTKFEESAKTWMPHSNCQSLKIHASRRAAVSSCGSTLRVHSVFSLIHTGDMDVKIYRIGSADVPRACNVWDLLCCNKLLHSLIQTYKEKTSSISFWIGPKHTWISRVDLQETDTSKVE